MNRLKAERKIRRKIARLKPCPFCGDIPSIEAQCDSVYSKVSRIVRKGCCPATGEGQTHAFLCNNFEALSSSRIWWVMTCNIVDEWNQRSPTKGNSI